MYHGENSSLECPDLEIFVKNNYKKYEIPTLSDERISNILYYNSFGY